MPKADAAEPDLDPFHAVIDLAGEQLVLRPIAPSDATPLQEMVRRSDPDDVRHRFHGALRSLPDALAARLTGIDHDHHTALVAALGDELVAVARLVIDDDGAVAEFALAVRSDHHRRGIGLLLMQRLIVYAGLRGVKTLWGQIERDNRPMLDLAWRLGFKPDGVTDGVETRVSLTL